MSFSYSKLTVAVAACLAGSVAMAADVEIYGKVDLGLEYSHVSSDVAGDSDSFKMTNGGSRFGFNIREQINNDWAIRGYLENGFNADDGKFTTSDTLFDRRMILAVQSKTYGEMGFGRMGTVKPVTRLTTRFPVSLLPIAVLITPSLTSRRRSQALRLVSPGPSNAPAKKKRKMIITTAC